jgi:hypothetical protein
VEWTKVRPGGGGGGQWMKPIAADFGLSKEVLTLNWSMILWRKRWLEWTTHLLLCLIEEHGDMLNWMSLSRRPSSLRAQQHGTRDQSRYSRKPQLRPCHRTRRQLCKPFSCSNKNLGPPSRGPIFRVRAWPPLYFWHEEINEK